VIEAAAEAGIPIVTTIHDYRLGCIGGDLFRDGAICTACVGRSPLPGILHGCDRGSRTRSTTAAIEIMSARRRSTLRRVDRFVAPTAFMADRLVDIGLPADRISVAPPFCSDPGERMTAPSGSSDVLFVGQLTAANGVRTLLRAWERCADLAGDTGSHLTIIGDGPLASEAREAAPRAVSFTGHVSHDDVRVRMLAARALVLPSESYLPFGTILIEAMAAGLPIVTTTASAAGPISGMPSRLIAPAGDASALADCISQLDDETVDHAGAAARARFLSAYSEVAGLSRLEALYSSVMADHPAPVP
jgi:glycosyltransferase involved in cell wall biosynthesis